MTQSPDEALDTEIDYSEEVRAEDTDKAPSTVTFTFFPNDDRPWAIDFAGACPRCGHNQPVLRRQLVTIAGASKMNEAQRRRAEAELADFGIDLSRGDETFPLRCSCQNRHGKRPSGKAGCGSSYNVRVVWEP